MARTIKALLLAALLAAIPATAGQIVKKGPGDDRITGVYHLDLYRIDQATDDAKCGTRRSGQVPVVCDNAGTVTYFYKYRGKPFFTRIECVINAVAQAAAAQTLQLNPFYATGDGTSGVAGAVLTPILDLETIVDGQAWEMDINELAPVADGFFTIENNFSGAGAGDLDVGCAVYFR